MSPDLKKEQKASSDRPRYRYSLAAKVFFLTIDLITGIPLLMIGFYAVLTRVMALTGIRRAFLFNAEFEDHAEHVYARFVEEHPEWERQPVNNEQVKERGALPTWADVFRRIGLDERDHMNMSLVFCGKLELVVNYDEMPERPGVVPDQPVMTGHAL